MLARVLVAAGLSVAVCAAARCQEPAPAPFVLGDDTDVVDVPTDVPTADPQELAVSEAGADTGVLVDEQPSSDGVVDAWPGAVGVHVAESDRWTTSLMFDALFMQRTNTVGPLAVTSQAADDPGVPVIAAGDVRYPTIPGARILLGRHDGAGTGYEIGYLGIWGMYADATAESPDGLLAVPDALGLVAGSGFDAASAIRPVLNGNLNSVELNLFSRRVYDGCRRHDPLPWRRVGMVPTADWILGIRWAGLDETAVLDVTALASDPPPVFRTTGYRVTTSSQLVGPQLGHRRRIDWGQWALEGWAKAAVTASFLSQAQSAVVGPFDLEVIREPRASTTVGVGMVGDVSATIVRRLGDHWGLRAGYSLLWFSGVAPAASQWDFTNTTSSGSRLVADTVFLHGATLGLEATW